MHMMVKRADHMLGSGEQPGGSPGGRGGFARDWYLGVLWNPDTYKRLVYLVLAFPIGLAVFAALVSLIAVGATLVVTLVGIPLLVATMYGWCYVAEFERQLANALLDTRIPPLSFAAEKPGRGVWASIRTRLENPLTWRALAFLFLRLPMGVVALLVVCFVLGVPLSFVSAPFLAEAGGGPQYGGWTVDRWYEGAILFPIGLALLPLALHGMNGVAYLGGQATRAFLRSDHEPTGEQIEHATRAAIAWRGLRFGNLTQAETQRQGLQLKIFGFHAIFFGFVSLTFLVLNGLSTPGTWWSLYVVWGVGFLFGTHLGYLLGGPLGAHAGLFLVTNLGLFVIDATYSDNWWFYWPIAGWLPFLLVHVLIDVNLRRKRRAAAPEAALSDEAVESPADEAVVAAPIAPADASQPEVTGESAPHVALQAGNAGAPGIVVDEEMRRVTVDGREVELTPKEFELLSLLARNPGRPFSRDEILDRVWQDDYEVTDRTVDTHVQRLRKKLGPQSEAIQTVWGIGYRYQR